MLTQVYIFKKVLKLNSVINVLAKSQILHTLNAFFEVD